MKIRFFAPVLGLLISVFAVWPVASWSLTAEQVYQKVSKSVFILYSLDAQTQTVKARGSAVAVSKDVVVTNCHVALSGDYLLIKLHHEDDKSQVARLFYKNEKQDLCFLEIQGASFTPVKIRASSKVQIGEEVFAIGNPKGTERTISQGIVSNKHEVEGGVWLQTDARIYFGSSGGGLFDANGNLVGITTKMGGNFGFALPTEWIMHAMTPEVMQHRYALMKDINISKPQTIDENKVQPEAISALAHLGNYGKDQIGLYRNNSECFLMIPGKDTNGNITSAVMWNPKYDTTLVIFPSVAAADQAISIVYHAVVDKKTQNQETYRSDSVLYIADHPYPLYGSKTIEKKYPFLVVVFTESPRSVFLNAGSFKIVYKDADPQIGNATVTYSLLGIAEGLSAYRAKCM
jgi:hypothetical protein